MKAIIEKSDTELHNDVLAELKYEPGVNVADIGVLLKDGTVTLNGYVTSYAEKWNAVTATKRVAGVRAIADDIVVKLPSSLLRNDGDIAGAAANQISWFSYIPEGAVKVLVREGWITLEGELEWAYQRNDVENNVKFLAGVRGVTNQIVIKSRLSSADVKSSIETAFERNALLDAESIEVEISGTLATLRGRVRNYAERDEAERVAWAAPGITSVSNKLEVRWAWAFQS